MSYSDAESNFVGQRNRSRDNYWDWTSEFDYLLASLYAHHATTAIKFMDATKAGETPSEAYDPFQHIRDVWADIFPGRRLAIDDYTPIIRSTIDGTTAEYSAQTMSDGERSAIYLAGRVLRASPGVLVVDEPENHLHSLLARQFWDTLEAARPDLRFVYITHDLAFARTRRQATFVLASPVDGLRLAPLAEGVPDDVAEILLGAASLSFYARRIVFCEGARGHKDNRLYEAWFNDRDTVVRPVGGSEMVHRCMSVLNGGWLVGNIQAIGIIDRDFHTDQYLSALPTGLLSLPVHELESLYCLPQVVRAVADYLGRPFEPVNYLTHLRRSVSERERQKVILERWKRRIEPLLIGLVASIHGQAGSLDNIIASLEHSFDTSSWGSSPRSLLEDEKSRVEDATTSGPVEDLLMLLPGKGLLAAAASYVGERPQPYIDLVNASLSGKGAESLGAAVESALATILPSRVVSTD